MEKQTKEKILSDLTKRADIKQVIRNITKNDVYYGEELYQELFIILCEQPEEKIIQMHCEGWIDHFIIRVLNNSFNSTTSPFYHKVKKGVQNKIDHIDEENGIDHMEELIDKHSSEVSAQYEAEVALVSEEIEKLYWYDRDIVKLWLKLGTVTAVSKQTGIGTFPLRQTMKSSKEELKKAITKRLSQQEQINFKA